MTLDQTPHFSRRRFLGATVATGAAVAVPGWWSAAAPAAAATTARWPGHQPGSVYLGMSTDEAFSTAVAATGPIGLHRTFGKWEQHRYQLKTIAADHAANRMPWVSFKPPPGHAVNQWRALAAGRYDAALRSRARSYARLDKPAIVTFHHEPSNGKNNQGRHFAAAWCHIHDIFERAGALDTIAFVPIFSEWLFSSRNRRRDPAAWVTRPLLRRVSRTGFLGIDIYETATHAGYESRLGAILRWTEARGFPDLMLGIGETGASAHWTGMAPETWIADNWEWCVSNRDRIGAVSYFNSTANSRPDCVWSLDEPGTHKVGTFKSMLATPTACDLSTL